RSAQVTLVTGCAEPLAQPVGLPRLNQLLARPGDRFSHSGSEAALKARSRVSVPYSLVTAHADTLATVPPSTLLPPVTSPLSPHRPADTFWLPPLVEQPLPLVRLGEPAISPQSLPVRCGNPAVSLDDLCVPGIQSSHRAKSELYR